jgi:ATP-dependent RNA helicase MSS116, mitochondrial
MRVLRIAQAKTGTGKTLAFLVPVIQRILADQPELATRARYSRARPDDIKGIIISPTRELAEQIAIEARGLCRETGIQVQCAVGGTAKGAMLSKTRREGCHLLVATPGRLQDLLQDPRSEVRAPGLSALVLDEADRMLEAGFAAELDGILERLPDPEEVPRQNLLFSATIPSNVVSLAKRYIDPQNFTFVQTTSKGEVPTHDRIPQNIITVKGWLQMFPTLLELLERERQVSQNSDDAMPLKAIVYLPFTHMVEMVTRAFHEIRRDGNLPLVFGISSKLTQMQRTRVTEMFKKAKEGILISSDVTARGMDFPNVSHVIQISVPPDREQYIHRLGRTGRAGKSGQGWLIVTDSALSTARQTLPGLPIRPADGFECAHFDIGNARTAPPTQFAATTRAFQMLPQDLLENVYLAFFGGGPGHGGAPRQLVRELNEWARLGWGAHQPPKISYNTAKKRGLLGLDGVNVEESRVYSRQDNRFGNRDEFRGRGNSRHSRRSDSFEDHFAGATEDRGRRRYQSASF